MNIHKWKCYKCNGWMEESQIVVHYMVCCPYPEWGWQMPRI